MKYLLLPYLVYILMLSFIATQVVFFAPPSSMALAYLVLILFVKLSVWGGSFSARSMQENYFYLFYVSILLFLGGMKWLVQGAVEGWLLYFFLMLPFYFMLFIMIFDDVYELIRLAKFYCVAFIVMSFLAMATEHVQLHYLGWSAESLWNHAAARYAHGFSVGKFRMLGLTGNPTVNAVSAVLAYAAYLMINENHQPCFLRRKYRTCKWIGRGMLLMTSLVVLFAHSGMGYILLALFVLMRLAIRYRIRLSIFRLIVMLSLIGVILGILFDLMGIYKVGTAYIFWNIERLWDAFARFIESDVASLLFGAPPLEPTYNIDKGVTLPLMAGGLFFFFAVMLFYLYRYRKASYHMKFFILLLLVGSMHYPVLVNQSIQVLFAMLLAIEYLQAYRKVPVSPIKSLSAVRHRGDIGYA